IRGVIWYQGESNADQAWTYRKLFPNLIQSWRATWDGRVHGSGFTVQGSKQSGGDFPFLFVQIANYGATNPQPVESTWAELREAQALSLSVPNTGMASAVDIGTGGDIHPSNKHDVGLRLALVAKAKVYGRKDIVDCGPTYDAMKM